MDSAGEAKLDREPAVEEPGALAVQPYENTSDTENLKLLGITTPAGEAKTLVVAASGKEKEKEAHGKGAAEAMEAEKAGTPAVQPDKNASDAENLKLLGITM